MDPVFAVVVADTAVERVRRQYEDEVTRIAYAAEQVVVELASTQLLDVQEYGESAQLQMNFQQTVHVQRTFAQKLNKDSKHHCEKPPKFTNFIKHVKLWIDTRATHYDTNENNIKVD